MLISNEIHSTCQVFLETAQISSDIVKFLPIMYIMETFECM